MPLPWSKKVVSVQKEIVASPQTPELEVVQMVAPPPSPEPEPEVVQTVEIPTVDDKISTIEHKNGEQVVDARQEDNEDNEVQGDVCQGEGVGSSDQGGKEDVEEARGS